LQLWLLNQKRLCPKKKMFGTGYSSSEAAVGGEVTFCSSSFSTKNGSAQKKMFGTGYSSSEAAVARAGVRAMPKISDYVKGSFHSNLNVVTPYFILIKAHMAAVDARLIPDHTSARVRSSGPPRTKNTARISHLRGEEQRDLRANHQRITICPCVTKNG
jgi:hypothetical protein